MNDELKNLIDTAMRREIESRALYEVAQAKSNNPIAKKLFKALAGEEEQHLEMIKKLGSDNVVMSSTSKEMLLGLKKSEFMLEEVIPKDMSVGEILMMAIKREQAALEFYSKMCSVFQKKEAKSLCEDLSHAELKHKVKLELMYDDLFYG